jgi:hypothetical protein
MTRHSIISLINFLFCLVPVRYRYHQKSGSGLDRILNLFVFENSNWNPNKHFVSVSHLFDELRTVIIIILTVNNSAYL